LRDDHIDIGACQAIGTYIGNIAPLPRRKNFFARATAGIA
jgi:hypothetical protein